MGRLYKALWKTAVILAAALAVTGATAGCGNVVTRNVSADLPLTQPAPTVEETTHQPPGAQTALVPASEESAGEIGKNPAQSNSPPDPEETKPTPSPLPLPDLTSLPTPTPVQLTTWMEEREDLQPSLAKALQEAPWAQDGVNRHEEQAIINLAALAGEDESIALSRWLAMPFLQTVEPADNAALQALRSVYRNDPSAYWHIMNHATIDGWVTDEWSAIIAALPGPRHPARGRYSIPQRFIDRLLDPEIVTVQNDTITLPLAGEVSIAIIRTGPGSEKSIDRLAHAIETAERFMAEPFPVNHVSLAFVDWPDDSAVIAINNHHALAVGTVLDVGQGDPNASRADYIIAHETAHFYWTGHHDWLNEGAAELIARNASQDSDSPYLPDWQCEHPQTDTIAELEALQIAPDQPHYACNYVVGLRHLTDMLETVGTEEFLDWFRSQYRARSTAPIP